MTTTRRIDINDIFIYLYNILGFVRLRWCPVILSIHPSRHLSSSVPSSVPMTATGASLSLVLNMPPHLRPLVLTFPWRLTRRRIHPWPLFFGHAR